MKGIIVVDLPVEESVEIDEYGIVADLKIRPTTPTNREDLFFNLKNVDIKPVPISLKEHLFKVDTDKLNIDFANMIKEIIKYNETVSEVLGK